MTITGNHMIDGDDGSHPQSPGYVEDPLCPDCDGRGHNIFSCCGDNISDNIDVTGVCPTCFEQCGEEDTQMCSTCEGNGTVTKEYFKERFEPEDDDFEL